MSTAYATNPQSSTPPISPDVWGEIATIQQHLANRGADRFHLGDGHHLGAGAVAGLALGVFCASKPRLGYWGRSVVLRLARSCGRVAV